MQIHELNNYSGNLDSGAFLAVDNGSDTGKVPATALTSDIQAAVEQIDSDLNARIDNIIAGGTAPSAAEVTDARRGASGINYASLGDAIRSQVEEIDEKLDDISVMYYGKNRYDKDAPLASGHLDSDGNLTGAATWKTTDYIYVKDLGTIFGTLLNSNNVRIVFTPFYACSYDENHTFIEQIGNTPQFPLTLNANVAYIRFSWNNPDPAEIATTMIEQGSAFTSYEPFSDELHVKTDSTLTKQNTPADAYAVGYELKHLTDTLDFEQASLTMTQGKLLNAQNGAIEDNANTNYRVSQYVPIYPNSKIMVRTDHFYGWGLYAFYDENQSFISGEAAASGGTSTYLYNKIVETPPNAAYVVVGLNYQSPNWVEPFLFVGQPQNAIASQIWSTKKWTCVGDSLTDDLNIRAERKYYDFIAGYTGIQLYNLGFSGCGYAQGNDNFMTKISDVPLDSDVITIFGSGNDGSAGLPLGTSTDSGTETLGGCINTTLDNLFAIMPVAQIGIITPTPWINNTPADNGWMENYSNLLVEICRLRSIPCLDLFHCSNLNPNSAAVRAAAYSRDNGGGVHPNELGHKIIASRIRAFLETLVI